MWLPSRARRSASSASGDPFLQCGEQRLADHGFTPALEDREVATAFGELFDVAAGGADFGGQGQSLRDRLVECGELAHECRLFGAWPRPRYHWWGWVWHFRLGHHAQDFFCAI